MPITYRPIGILHTPYTTLDGMPIQPPGAARAAGTAEVEPELAEGLRDLDGFSHVILVYHLHAAGAARLTVTPFLAAEPHGVFATRAPSRPNPIGLSVVELVRVEGNVLHLVGVDVLDGTPLLDIKPYVPAFDAPDGVRVGWLARHERDVKTARSDERFGPRSSRR